MNNPSVILVLRLIHVVSGVLWVGAAAMLAAYVLPAVRASTTGMLLLRQLIWVGNLPRYLNVLLVLALGSGSALYTNLLVLTHGQWAGSRVGLTLGVGGAAAFAAAAVATWVAAPAVHEALRLAEGAQGATPDPAMNALLQRYARAMWVVVALLLVTTAAMATARYL